VPQFIEELYLERFGKTAPDELMSSEERAHLEHQRKEARRAARQRRGTEVRGAQALGWVAVAFERGVELELYAIALQPLSSASFGTGNAAKFVIAAARPALTAILRIFMIISMRSTVVIEDELFKKAKQRATALKMTLSEVVNQALRESLSRPVAEAPAFHMITFGDTKARVHREPSDFEAIIEGEERYRLRR
jgi:hypothetical protein